MLYPILTTSSLHPLSNPPFGSYSTSRPYGDTRGSAPRSSGPPQGWGRVAQRDRGGGSRDSGPCSTEMGI